MKYKLVHVLGIPVLLWAAAFGQDIVPGRFIVELSEAPAIEGAKSSRNIRSAAVQSEQRRLRTALQQRAVDVVASVELVANALVVNASEEQAGQIAAMPGVVRVTPVKLYHKMLDRAVILQGITEAWAQIGGQSSAGLGIKIGVIDTGIDLSHPAFADPSLQAPDGFPKVTNDADLPNTNGKVIVARNYDRRNTAKDVDGHGTGVAMIAAGVTNSGPRATITGIAPKAYLGNYKVFPDSGGGAPSDAILKALDDAYADGMDVVNLSLGSFPAGRVSEDPLARAVERSVNQGMIVVIAAGNEGPDLNTIASPATAPSAITVGNAYTDRIFASTASFPGLQTYVVLPGSGRGSAQPIRAAVGDVSTIESTGLACSTLPADSLSGKIALVLRGTCFFEDKLNNVQRAGAIAALVYTHSESPNPITMTVGGAQLPAAMVSYVDGLNVKARIAEDPALLLTIDFSPRPFPIDPSRVNDSSSKGPNNDLAIKPDLVAVGTSVYTAAPGSAYLAASGTSFSAPMVAGAAALLKAARPGLTAQQYRSLLVNSAGKLGSGLPSQHTGAGILNLGAALRATAIANPPSIAFNAGSGTVDLTRTFTLQNISRAADIYTISVVSGNEAVPSVSTTTVQLGPGSSRDIQVRFQGDNLAPRAYEGILVVRGTQSDVESHIPYWYAVRSQNAALISVIEPSSRGALSSRQRLRFRVLDGAGVPLMADPKVTVEQGGGSVLDIASLDAAYPGVFLANVRLGEAAGDNIFLIEAAGITRRITITGE